MKILIVQTGFLGDVILSTPLSANLKSIYPDAELWFLTTPAAKPLLVNDPNLTGVITFDKRRTQSGARGLLALVRILRRERFDAVFSLHKSFRTALLLALAGIKKRYGFKEAAGAFLYSRVSPRRDLGHEVLRNLAILRNIDIQPQHAQSRLNVSLSPELETVAERYFAGSRKPRLGIAPGSVWATKRWTTQGFAEVAHYFSTKGFEIVILGGEADRDLAETISRESEARDVLNLAGHLPLDLSAAVISRCDLFLTNDSAPLHLASAFKVPTVAIFCATTPEMGFGPWENNSETVGVAGLECRPCGRHGSQRCPLDTNACQLGLKSEVVISALHRVYERGQNPVGEKR